MLSIFLIGIALSMDAFSVSISLGLSKIRRFKELFLIICVSLFHFLMPLSGNLLGEAVLNIININSHALVAIIFLFLSVIMYFDENRDKNYNISTIISIILISFSVSIDSFFVGIGISGITNHKILSYLIFSLCSGSITYIGLIVGKYIYKKINYNHLGSIILFIFSIVNICKIFIYKLTWVV